jgi:hypothetical protein
MLASEIVKGGKYKAKIGGNVVTVKVLEIRKTQHSRRNTYGGGLTMTDKTVYDVLNLSTKRKTTFKSAAKFRSKVEDKSVQAVNDRLPEPPQETIYGRLDNKTSIVPQCKQWVKEGGTEPVSQRCRLEEGHEGPCCGVSIGVAARMGWKALRAEYDRERAGVPNPMSFDEWVGVKYKRLMTNPSRVNEKVATVLQNTYSTAAEVAVAYHNYLVDWSNDNSSNKPAIQDFETWTLANAQPWITAVRDYLQRQQEPHNRPVKFADWWNTRNAVPEPPKPVQNIVQWLPRDPVTGDERIRIAMAGGTDREYLFIESKQDVMLEYLGADFVAVRYMVKFDRNAQAVSCTCDDHAKRKHACKHIKALNAAMSSRLKPLMFE